MKFQKLVCIVIVLLMVTTSAVADRLIVDFNTATDEELIAAVEAIQAEQRARLVTRIDLDCTELSLKKGATQKISATVVDLADGVTSSKLTWSSSDKSVATVSGNTVTAAGAGTATITCSTTLSDGTELSAECLVTVFIPVGGINVSKQKIDLGAGQTVESPVTVQPKNATNQTLAFTSSDTSVATVDTQGVVTGIGIGTATITATSTDGTEKSASFKVVVTKKDDVGVTKTTRKGVSIKLLSSRTNKGSSYFKPADGNVFVFPQFEISNGSDSEITISSIMSVTVYCDGYSVTQTFEAACAEQGDGLDFSIFPGKKAKGEYGIEVPSDWKELEFRISPSFWDDSLSFMLYNQ